AAAPAAGRDRRLAAGHVRAAPGVPVRPPVPVRPGRLRRGDAGPGRTRRAPVRLPPPCQRRESPGRARRALMAGSGSMHLRPEGERVLSVEEWVVEFHVKGGQTVHAVSSSSIELAEGEAYGDLGEAGCGKASAGRAIMQLPPPTSGQVGLGGEPLTGEGGEKLRQARSQMQMIFQDPVSSLNPRRKVKDLVAEGPRIWGRQVSDDKI